MRCKIADLLVEVPATGDMESRCREYLTDEAGDVVINIRQELYDLSRWGNLNEDGAIYMESALLFYSRLFALDGMMLHSSAIELDGKAYLFSGPSGMGKSTHTRLWKELFGDRVRVFNDDKPALRKIDGVWYAYGTPWCGKDGINCNLKVPLAGICFLRKGNENTIRRLDTFEASGAVISQTMRRATVPEHLSLMLKMVDRLVADIPIFELINRPEPAAAMLSYETMSRCAKEMEIK